MNDNLDTRSKNSTRTSGIRPTPGKIIFGLLMLAVVVTILYNTLNDPTGTAQNLWKPFQDVINFFTGQS